MSKVSITFGLLLIIVGVVGYLVPEAKSFTAFIPSVFGFILLVCGMIALRAEYRKHAMHAAAAVGLLCLLGCIPGVLKLPALFAGTAERAPAVIAQSVTALICLIFVALCVKSFIDARRSGKV